VDVLAGGRLGFATVSSGGALNVSGGGNAANIVVASSGSLNVAGTTTSNIRVLGGGTETISSGERRRGQRRGRFGHVGCGR
jgi:autotransporter passenger strand-loop-strand repeat protein